MTKNRHQNMYICIFFGPIYQNGHQIVTTSSPLLALKTGISYPPHPFPSIEKKTFNWFFFLVILPVFHVYCLLYNFMSIQVYTNLNYNWMFVVSFLIFSISNTHISNNMLFECHSSMTLQACKSI